jgi:protein-S-isoprenylcysteine O-methyltransferase Ste14
MLQSPLPFLCASASLFAAFVGALWHFRRADLATPPASPRGVAGAGDARIRNATESSRDQPKATGRAGRSDGPGGAVNPVGLRPLAALRCLKVVFAGGAVVGLGAVLRAPVIEGRFAWPLLLGSAALFAWSVRATWLERPSLAFSPDEPHFLLRRGPYRLVRHPFYVSYLLFFAALFAAVPAPGTALAWLAVWAVYSSAARAEERKFAASPLAGAYLAYADRVGGFLPRIKGLRRKAGGRQVGAAAGER